MLIKRMLFNAKIKMSRKKSGRTLLKVQLLVVKFTGMFCDGPVSTTLIF